MELLEQTENLFFLYLLNTDIFSQYQNLRIFRSDIMKRGISKEVLLVALPLPNNARRTRARER